MQIHKSNTKQTKEHKTKPTKKLSLFGLTYHYPKLTISSLRIEGKRIKRFHGNFWQAKQKKSYSLHNVPYRGSFRPELVEFLLKYFSDRGDTVLDPFGGRGTVALQAILMQRKAITNDVNPLSKILAQPRIELPTLSEVKERLKTIPVMKDIGSNLDFSMFFHPKTFLEILSIRHYFRKRKLTKKFDLIDNWIQMVATCQLTGQTKGFFSVPTVSSSLNLLPDCQHIRNQKKGLYPMYQNIHSIIIKKSDALLKDVSINDRKRLRSANVRFTSRDASKLYDVASASVNLVITSPPFLDLIHYGNQNWLKCWFNDIDVKKLSDKLMHHKFLSTWTIKMQFTLHELFRVTKRGGIVCIEVAPIKIGKVTLDCHIASLGIKAGFHPMGILSQNHGKKHHSRIVIFQKM